MAKLSHRLLVTGTIATLAASALLVVYFDNRTAEQMRQQRQRILEEVCEQAAMVLATRIRDLFGAVVFETLEGFGHPELYAYNLPEIARHLGIGVGRHPYVKRFFLWSEQMPVSFSDQVLFYRMPTEGTASEIVADSEIIVADNEGVEVGAFFAQPEFGKKIWELSQPLAKSQRSFAVIPWRHGGVPYQIVIHYVWKDDARSSSVALIGYLVDLQDVQDRFVVKLLGPELQENLNSGPDSPQLALTVLDDQRRVVYGPPVRQGVPSAAAFFSLLFFPEDFMTPFVVNWPESARWQLVVAAAGPPAAARNYGPLMAVILIFVALLCAVAVERQAIRLSDLQSEFVANVTHQLKTPLAVLSGASQTLEFERVRSPEKLRQYIEIVQTQTARLSALVERILHFERSERARPKPQWQLISLVTFTREVVERYQLDEARSVSYRFEAQGEVPLIRGDALALEQVVLNLLDNAEKYRGTGGDPLVRVYAANGYVTLSVRDYGIGIDPADLPHVFEKFYRGQRGAHHRRGFGLGLAIVRRVVEAHGGRVTVKSTPGEGSEFCVSIPAVESA